MTTSPNHEFLPRMISRTEMETELRRAIQAEEFEIHYQPIVDLRSFRIMGAEALARWNHADLGRITPAEFIPIAEETGLIVPLGRWILENACCQAQKWQYFAERGSAISVTVNISSRQFKDDSLIDSVATALAISGLAPHNLVLEVTEATMLQDTTATAEKMAELKDIGVRLAIDDFGTGYSSLSFLQRFPIDILKIDKCFIDEVCHGGEGAALTRAIVVMGDMFHLKTVAEGIESHEQAAVLRNLGCELGQGYHIARPMTPEKMDEFLSENSSYYKSGVTEVSVAAAMQDLDIHISVA